MQATHQKGPTGPHAYTAEALGAAPRREIAEKRTEAGKVYALGENVYQTVLSGEAVHYRDKRTGKWAEIDNTLESRTDAGGDRLVNRANGRLKVALAPTDAAWTVELENEQGARLAWRLEIGDQGENAGQARRKPTRVAPRAKTAAEALFAKATGEAAYGDILPQTDLHCRIEGTTFKEDIVFKTSEATGPVSFTVEARGLTLRLLPDQSAEAVDENGRTAFVLPAPDMKDAKGNPGSVRVALSPISGDLWRLVYTPDAAFLAQATYPVTLDPTVRTTDLSATAFKKNVVKASAPETVFPGADYAAIEDGASGTRKTIGYYRFEQAYLPPVDSSYYVTDATLSLASTAPANTLFLHEVETAWDPAALTYANRPSLRAECADALVYGSGVSTLTVTDMVRGWYEGTNNGFAAQIKSENGTTVVSTTVYSLSLTITYVSLAGLAGHLSYESHGVGRAGTAHVGLFNGNLVLEHRDMATAGARMPVSVSHYYNACNYDLDLYKAGKGWRHSLQVTLHREVFAGDASLYYVLTDGTGTRHHFKLRSGVTYDDLSGLYLTLTVSGTKATIEDKGNNQMEFDLPTVNSNGRDGQYKLVKLLRNAHGDTLTVTGSADGRVLSATDGIGRVTRFDYAESSMLQAIYPPDSDDPGIEFFYDEGGHLARVAYADETESGYAYDTDGRLVAIQSTRDKLTVEYHAASGRVKRVLKTHGEMQGDCKLYEYAGGVTRVTDGTVAQGKAFVYHFNDYGNVVSVHDMNGLGTFASYSGTVPKHRPAFVSRVQSFAGNLLKNHSFEAGDAWSYAGGAGIVTGNARIGARCLGFVHPAQGGVQTATQAVTLAGGRYTLSLYAKKTGAMDLRVAARYQNSLGAEQEILSGSFRAEVTEAYGRIAHTFALPDGMEAQAVQIVLIAQGNAGEAGSLWVDCAQLEAGPVPNQYNLLENGDFAVSDANGLPGSWTRNAADAADDRVFPAAAYWGAPETLPAQAMRLTGMAGNTAKAAGFYQEMNISGLMGDAFVAGGWSAGFSMPRKGLKKKYNIRVAFKTSTIFTDAVNEVQWNEEWSAWQFACGPVFAPANYTAIRFHVDYEGNLNRADFTGLFLYKEDFGWSYTYDAMGNILTIKDPTGKTRTATYDAYSNMTAYQPAGQPSTVKMLMTYGTTVAEYKRHLAQKVTSPLRVVQDFTYDTAGNRLTGKLTGTDGKDFIQNETRYGADKNHAFAVIDSRGQTSVRQRSQLSGEPLFAANDQGMKLMWGFDQDKKIAGMMLPTREAVYRNQYLFSEDMQRMLEAKHNMAPDAGQSTRYRFTYDEMGNITDSHIGDALYASTEYTETGDKLPVRTAFGNGCSVRYTRDAFKRITGVQYDSDTEPRYLSHYDGTGKATRAEDLALGRVAEKMFDPAGRPEKAKETQGGQNIRTETAQYDECNRIQKQREIIRDGAPYEMTYAYDIENKRTSVILGGAGARIDYTYDALSRMGTATRRGTGGDCASTYTYLAGGYGAGSTSLLVARAAQPGFDCAYTFDPENRVRTEKFGNLTIGYEYDLFGQLVRVDDPRQEKSFTYAYDLGGNILSKAEYAYTAGRLGEPVRVVAYAYGDPDWKDKLTNYDGAAIASDAIGNVTGDGPWSYAWTMGRFLARMESAADTVTFTYNADGLRVGKANVVGGATEYIVSGTNIIHASKPDADMHFWQTGGGKPDMITYNGQDYYYLYNLQGDVIALLDRENGCEAVVRYAYDAWGKPMACEGAMATTLGKDNPFRYRGYVYDEETGLYYLGGRYYNPVWGRFISGDSLTSQRSNGMHNNLFTYCGNAPAQGTDPSAVLLYGSSFFTAASVNLRW